MKPMCMEVEVLSTTCTFTPSTSSLAISAELQVPEAFALTWMEMMSLWPCAASAW